MKTVLRRHDVLVFRLLSAPLFVLVAATAATSAAGAAAGVGRSILRHDVGWFDKDENAVGVLTTQLEEDASKVTKTRQDKTSYPTLPLPRVSRSPLLRLVCLSLPDVYCLTLPCPALPCPPDNERHSGSAGDGPKRGQQDSAHRHRLPGGRDRPHFGVAGEQTNRTCQASRKAPHVT